MPRITINGVEYEADARQSVIEVARANGVEIPALCWHPKLSVAGNCRICAVQVEGRSWVEIACNMPVADGLKVLTDSELVRDYRRNILELQTLNHPVDCGVCDKAGECLLQDYHYEHNGNPSTSRDAKVHATKFHPLSSRITLDNERCVLCSRCVRFTHEISKTKSLGIVNRGDHSLVRASEDGAFEHDAYSDNVVDICPVGALLSKSFLYKSRVWYLKPTPSVCNGCSRGCSVDLWHRKPEWRFKALDAAKNRTIERVTPRENAAVNGPWVCNYARDLPRYFERPRATEAMVKGSPVPAAEALAAAARLIAASRHGVALVSSNASNEELSAFKAALGTKLAARVKVDRVAAPGEVVEDDFLIRADKCANTAGARALFPEADDPKAPLPAQTDLILVWGEGFDPKRRPSGARVIYLCGWQAAEHAGADVVIPIAIQTETRGTFTNFQGVEGAFEPCFEPPPGVQDACHAFAALSAREVATA